VTRDEVDLLIRRAGLTLDAGQKADLAVSFQHLVTLAAKIPRDRKLADEPAFVFLPPPQPAGQAGPAPSLPTAPARKPAAKPKPAARVKAAPAAKPAAKAAAKSAAKPAAKPAAKAKAKAKPTRAPARPAKRR
jgi:hypothetical protein